MTAPTAQWRCHGTAGDSDANSAAFRSSLLGSGPLTVSPSHWLAVVLASKLPPAVAGRISVTMRLTIFAFVPAFKLAPATPQVSLPYYPVLKQMGKFLQALIDAGMPFDELPSPTEARACVSEVGRQIFRTRRVCSTTLICAKLARQLIGLAPPQLPSLWALTPTTQG